MSYLSSVCKSPSSCGGNCRCGNPSQKTKVLRVATMKGKTSKTKSYPMPKPTMGNHT
jgi:hypothetical protein